MCEEDPNTARVTSSVRLAAQTAESLYCHLEVDFMAYTFTRQDLLGRYADEKGYLKEILGVGWKGAQFRALNILGFLIAEGRVVQIGSNSYQVRSV